MCKDCNKVVGKTSKEEDDFSYQCAECHDKQELEYHCLQGKNYDPKYLKEQNNI